MVHLPVFQREWLRWAALLGCLGCGVSRAQMGTPAAAAVKAPERLRTHVWVYDLRDGSKHEVYAADAVWEAPNWSPDGKYLILNSGGAIYKLVLKADGTAEAPQRLAIPAGYRCNNDKAISPDGKRLGFSAVPPGSKGSEVFVAGADGSDVKQLTTEAPSYFHGWSPDSRTMAFVGQRGGSGQYDVYTVPVTGGAETRLNSSKGQDDGPDYSPDGKWIYINSDRTGKEAAWRFPATGAGIEDAKAEMVVNDELQDWFPHVAPDGTKLLYIGYPAGTPTHDPRDAQIQLRLATISGDKVSATTRTLVTAVGGQGSLNVSSWAPDSERFAYVTFEALP